MNGLLLALVLGPASASQAVTTPNMVPGGGSPQPFSQPFIVWCDSGHYRRGVYVRDEGSMPPPEPTGGSIGPRFNPFAAYKPLEGWGPGICVTPPPGVLPDGRYLTLVCPQLQSGPHCTYVAPMQPYYAPTGRLVYPYAIYPLPSGPGLTP